MGKYTVFINENMGEVNWEMVKKADIHGVMLCAGHGGEVDRLFRANADCCEKLGIPFGVYWTSYAVTGRDAEAEKRELKGMIEGYHIEGPVRIFKNTQEFPFMDIKKILLCCHYKANTTS